METNIKYIKVVQSTQYKNYFEQAFKKKVHQRIDLHIYGTHVRARFHHLYPLQLKIAPLASLRKCLLKCVVCSRASLWS